MKALLLSLGPLSWWGCSVGTQGRAWPSGLQGGHETSRERARLHSREGCPGAQGGGGREPDVPRHLAPRGQAPAAFAQPALTQSKVRGRCKQQQGGPVTSGEICHSHSLSALRWPQSLLGRYLGEDEALSELTLSVVLSYHMQCQAEMDLGGLCQPLAEGRA